MTARLSSEVAMMAAGLNRRFISGMLNPPMMPASRAELLSTGTMRLAVRIL